MLDRKTPPPFVNSTSFDLIEPITENLSNGIRLFFIPGGSQEVLKIEVLFQAGRWFENKTAVSQFAANLLTKGTKTKSSFEVAKIFDQYGAHVEIHPGFDVVSVSVYTVTQYLEPVLTLFSEVLTTPSFPEKEIAQHKTVVIQNIKVNEEKTSYLASKAFRRSLFGSDHPYGREMEEKDVSILTQKDITEHFASTFARPLVFVAGKITESTRDVIARAFSKLAAREPRTAGNRVREYKSFSEKISKEGSVQASIRIGRKALLRSHPDYASAIFVNHILGGYFGSRLMKNIREEKGLTYGIYSSIQPLQHESFLVIGADVNKENVELTIAEIQKELKILRNEKISSEELNTARNHFIGSLQSELSTPFAHADKIKTIVLSQLAPDYYQNLVLTIDRITAENIIDTTEKYFHEDSLSSVSVG